MKDINPLDLVNKQAEDEGIWFRAEYASEAYLQRAIRELHDSVEKYFESEGIGQ